jgi:hypothetical protein
MNYLQQRILLHPVRLRATQGSRRFLPGSCQGFRAALCVNATAAVGAAAVSDLGERNGGASATAAMQPL